MKSICAMNNGLSGNTLTHIITIFLKPLRFLYLIWSACWFILSFLLLFPFFWLFIQKKSWKKNCEYVNRVWCRVFFPIAFLRVKKLFEFKPEAGKQYIYCVNHASYLDIPVLTYVLPGFNAFIGKSDIAQVPLFGYMFRNLHITVNRRSSKDKALAIQRSKEFLDDGRSLIFFPEGGIRQKKQPGLASFKDGAFRLSVELNIPIVPVSLPFNWKILPDSNMLQPNPGTIYAIMHNPIYPTQFKDDPLEAMKQEVFRIIEADLKKWNPDSCKTHGNR